MLPQISRAAILAAICQFDSELRATDAWASWETNRAHRWAIAHAGQRYPVKQITALASGSPASAFSGGEALNTRLARLGFTVVALEQPEPPGAATSPAIDLQQRIVALEQELAAARLLALAEQARLRLALIALAEVREYAGHAASCEVAPCACGFVAADARSIEVVALTAGEQPLTDVLAALHQTHAAQRSWVL